MREKRGEKVLVRKRAQIAMEYVLIFAFAFLMTIPLIIVFSEESNSLNDDITNSQVDRISKEIMDGVDSVHFLGEPSQKTITIYMPKNVKSVDITGNTITFTMYTTREYEISKWSIATLTGNMSANAGLHIVRIRAINNTVDITDKP